MPLDVFQVRNRPTPVVLTVHSDLTGRLCVEYGRRSNAGKKNPGKSCKDQLDVLDVNTAGHGLVIAPGGRLSDDAIGASRYSARKTRQNFETIMHMVKTMPIAVIALWELSRATRRLKIFGELMELCEERNVLLLILDRLLDPRDHRDRQQLGFQAVMDEAYSAESRQRTLRGVLGAAEAGLPHGRHVYGYQRYYNSRTGALERIEIVPEQARIIREIARRVLVGGKDNTSREIARDLNRRAALEEPGTIRPLGGDWSATEIRDILTSPTYYGKRRHTLKETGATIVHEGAWPAILTEEQWIQLQRIFAARSRGDHETNAKYLLTGIVICDSCDTPMYAQDSRRKKLGDRKPAVGYECGSCSRTCNMAHLDAHVTAYFQAWLASDDFRAAELSDTTDDELRADHEALTFQQGELATLDQELKDDQIDRRTHTIEVRKVQARIDELEARINKATRSTSAFTHYREMGIERLDDMTIEGQRDLMRSFIRVRIRATSRRGRGFDSTRVRIVPA